MTAKAIRAGAIAVLAIAAMEILGLLPAKTLAWLVGMSTMSWLLAAGWLAWRDRDFHQNIKISRRD